jgi:hypothetical protein
MILYSPFSISAPLQMVLVLLLPAGTLAFGDIITRAWMKEDLGNTIQRLLADFVVGTAILLSGLLFGGLIGILVPVEAALEVVLVASCAYWCCTSFLSRRFVLRLPNLGKLDWAAVVVFIGYVTRVCLILATKPIQDADAMALYIPMGRVFTTLGSIPVFDPFHYWRFSSAPGVSLMYSWAFTLSGSTQSEAFRVIPVLAFFLLPLAVFTFVQQIFKSRTAASIALIITVFQPSLDFLVYYYSFYPDALAIALLLIAWTFYRKIPSTRLSGEFLVGMCLGSLLIIKYDIGLFATATVMLMMISRAFANPTTTKVFRTCGVAVISAVFVLGANSLYGLLSVGYTIYLPILFLIGTLIIVSYRYVDELEGPITSRSFVAVFLMMLPALIWQVRSLLVGASLFGVSFLSLSAVLPGTASPVVYNSANSFSIYTILEPFLHPWYNLFFFPVSIFAFFYAARKRNITLVILLFLTYFLYYLTIIGAPPSGRHLMFAGLLNACVIGVLLADYRPPRFVHWQYPTLVFYCATSMLAWPTVYYYVTNRPDFSQFQELGLIPYQGSYTLGYIIGNFSQHFLPFYGALAAAVLLTLSFYRISTNSKSSTILKQFGKASLLFLVLVGSFLQFTPYLALASSETHGNVLNFSTVGSYYQSDLNVSATVVKILPVNSTVITYSNPALAFTNPKVLDLSRGGAEYLQAILQGVEGESVSRVLLKHGFVYLLLPSDGSPRFGAFMGLANQTQVIQQILADPWILPVNVFPGWVLYEITLPS